MAGLNVCDNDISVLRSWMCNKGQTFESSKFTFESVPNRSLLVKDNDDDLIKALSEECLKLDAAPTQSLANYRSMKEFILCLEAALPESYKKLGAYFCPFGSSVTNFWTEKSDLDVSLVVPQTGSDQITVLKDLEAEVKKQWPKFKAAGLESCSLIEAAKVPVLKFYGLKEKPFLDVSVNNTVAISNSHLVALFGLLDPRVPILGRLIKRWAQLRGINDRSQGTISSYTLMLFLFWFLQNRNPAILPKYNLISKEAVSKSQVGCEELCCTDHGCKVPFVVNTEFILKNLWLNREKNEESVGRLLYEFFMFFGDESIITSGIKLNLRDGSRTITGDGHMIAVCPTREDDQSVHVNSATLEQVTAELKRARRVLQESKSLRSLYATNN